MIRPDDNIVNVIIDDIRPGDILVLSADTVLHVDGWGTFLSEFLDMAPNNDQTFNALVLSVSNERFKTIVTAFLSATGAIIELTGGSVSVLRTRKELNK